MLLFSLHEFGMSYSCVSCELCVCSPPLLTESQDGAESFGTNCTLKDGRRSVAAQRDEHQTKQSTQAFDKLLNGQGFESGYWMNARWPQDGAFPPSSSYSPLYFGQYILSPPVLIHSDLPSPESQYKVVKHIGVASFSVLLRKNVSQ